MEVVRVAEGLWRWTAYYEEWRDEVGCVVLRGARRDRPDRSARAGRADRRRHRFWEALDRDVKRAERARCTSSSRSSGTRGAPPRSSAATAAGCTWRAAPARRSSAGRTPSRTCSARATRCREASRRSRAAAPPRSSTGSRQHRALVPGDVILGADDGGLRLCPQSWLPAGVDHARAARGAGASARSAGRARARLARRARARERAGEAGRGAGRRLEGSRGERLAQRGDGDQAEPFLPREQRILVLDRERSVVARLPQTHATSSRQKSTGWPGADGAEDPAPLGRGGRRGSSRARRSGPAAPAGSRCPSRARGRSRRRARGRRRADPSPARTGATGRSSPRRQRPRPRAAAASTRCCRRRSRGAARSPPGSPCERANAAASSQ